LNLKNYRVNRAKVFILYLVII